MSIASGFSIQRDDVIQVPHRQQYETHDAISGDKIYLLRSLPDYEDKTWEWDIRMGEVRIHLDRGSSALAVNGNNLTATGVGPTGAYATELLAWNENAYTEGATIAGLGSVMYDSQYGEFGAIVFDESAQPMPGEIVEISYVEHVSKFTGDGGLLFQLAHDMCIHPFNSPEIFQNRFGNHQTLTDDNTASIDGTTGNEYKSNIPTGTNSGGNDQAIVATASGGDGGTSGSGTLSIFRNNLSIDYRDIFNTSGIEATQRTVDVLWKVVKEHKESSVINMSANAGTANDQVASYPAISSTYSLAQLQSSGIAANYIPLMIDFPLIESDLGGGEFRVSIDGQIINRDDWVVTCDTATRMSTFKLKRTTPMAWITDIAAVNVSIAYLWKKSIDVPFGALVGRKGLGPDQVTDSLTAAKLGFPHDDTASGESQVTDKYWIFSRAFRAATKNAEDISTPNRAYFGWHTPNASSAAHIVTAQATNTNAVVGLDNVAVIPATSPRHKNIAKILDGDVLYLQMESSGEYARAFNLIYPTPLTTSTATSDIDIKAKLREITDRFVVESDKGVDLLSDTNLSFINSNSPASNRKPQKWRMRFVWDETTLSLKVNVGTSYQILDDCTVTEVQGRDGIKSPVFREPGELCDVYQTSSIGRGTSLSISRAKSQWFKKSQIEKNIARSYPMSYKMTCTDHGMALFVFDQASVDQDDDYAWLVIQRHVNQTTGEPEFSDKSPVHCVYSPSKRPVDVATLTPYYASSDIEDMSKPPAVFSSLAGVFKTEAPTVYISKDAGFFNGKINAIDFNGYGYASGTVKGQIAPTALAQSDVKTDLFRGITGNQASSNTNYWYEKTYSFFVDTAAGDFDAIQVGHYIATKNTNSDDANISTLPYVWGGRIKEWVPNSGKLTISSVNNILLDATETQLATAFTNLTSTPPKAAILLNIGTSGSGDVTDGTFVPFSQITTVFDVLLRSGAYEKTTVNLLTEPTINTSGPSSVVTDLSVIGFNSLPRRRDTSIVLNASVSPGAIQQVAEHGTSPVVPAIIRSVTNTGGNMTETTPPAASWAATNDLAVSFSENVIWPTNIIERMSKFKAASADGTGVPTAVENINLSSYSSGDSALLDILYTAQPNNVTKVFESMVVALDDVEVSRDKDAYILTYDEWTRRGDPSTVPRFMESLEAAGVTNLGADFKIPATGTSTSNRPDFNALVPGMDTSAASGSKHIITNTTQNSSTGKTFFSEWDTTTSGAYESAANTSGAISGDHSGAWVAGVDYPTWTLDVGQLVTSTNAAELLSKLPGDVIWKSSDSSRNSYMYDFWNKSLYFKLSPRAGTTFSISMINYQTSNPAQGTYIISTPEDRNFPETNMNDVKSINRFVVREKDVLKPWDYHVSATMHEIDSHAIINPMEQLSITQGRNFVFSFPTQLTSQRFYYPESELDLICVSSADFSTQAGFVEINKYTDSDGINSGDGAAAGAVVTAAQSSMRTAQAANVVVNASSADGTQISDLAVGAYGGHTGPDGEVYIWRKNKRKYEGMPSTLPNGNGMRIFMQVTGSSIRHSDVEEGVSPPTTAG